MIYTRIVCMVSSVLLCTTSFGMLRKVHGKVNKRFAAMHNNNNIDFSKLSDRARVLYAEYSNYTGVNQKTLDKAITASSSPECVDRYLEERGESSLQNIIANMDSKKEIENSGIAYEQSFRDGCWRVCKAYIDIFSAVEKKFGAEEIENYVMQKTLKTEEGTFEAVWHIMRAGQTTLEEAIYIVDNVRAGKKLSVKKIGNSYLFGVYDYDSDVKPHQNE